MKCAALGVLLILPGCADLERARADYPEYCAACHGKDGNADGPLAARLDPRPIRHSDAAAMGKLTDEYLTRLLKEGGAALGKSPLMVPWGKTLSDERIADLVAYLRTLPARQDHGRR